MNTFTIIIPVYKLLDPMRLECFEQLVESISTNMIYNSHYLKNIIVINDYPQQKIHRKVQEVFSKKQLTEYLIIENNDKNRGQAYSRNLGAELANSKYLHFVDQDDFISRNFYTLLDFDKDILIGNIKLYFQNSNSSKEYHKRGLKIKYKTAKTIDDLKLLLLSNITFSPGQYLIRKELFDKVGGFPDLNSKGADDYGLFVKLIDQSNASIAYNKEATFFYRIHDNQSKNSLNMQQSLSEFLKEYQPSQKIIRILTYIKLNPIFKLFRIGLNRTFLFNRVN